MRIAPRADIIYKPTATEARNMYDLKLYEANVDERRTPSTDITVHQGVCFVADRNAAKIQTTIPPPRPCRLVMSANAVMEKKQPSLRWKLEITSCGVNTFSYEKR